MGYIVSQFKQYAYKQITYTVTPSSTLVNQLIGDGRPLQKGDTVIIQDDNYMDIDGNVGLILSARVSEIITSDTNPANNKIVFSNYKKLKSEASSDIKAIVSQLVNDATPYFADIATSNGVQFKNGTGSTTYQLISIKALQRLKQPQTATNGRRMELLSLQLRLLQLMPAELRIRQFIVLKQRLRVK